MDPLDPEGGQRSVEHGYDGRYRCLFGPDGIPWGRLLQSTITKSLTEAIEDQPPPADPGQAKHR